MASCKECLHYEVCVRRINSVSLDPMKCGYKCPEFKNKSDYAEVVRCKDCKKRYSPCNCALWYASKDGNEYFLEKGDDFSCSHGKRKGSVNND